MNRKEIASKRKEQRKSKKQASSFRMKTLRAAGLRKSQILITASRGPDLGDIGSNLCEFVVLEDVDKVVSPFEVVCFHDPDFKARMVEEFDRLTDGRFSEFYATRPEPYPITVNDPGNKLRDTGYMDLIAPDKKVE
jgi:hypothetical protein